MSVNKKRNTSFVLARILYTMLFIIIQVAILVVVFLFFKDEFAYFYVICVLLSIAATMHILNDESTPEYKIAWLVPILLLPIFGGLLYIMFGNYRMGKDNEKLKSGLQKEIKYLVYNGNDVLEKLRKENKDSMKKKVDEMLEVVKIEEYQNRLPERLSGGQQQRVALARAIVITPNVLLMDEPLSNLDAKLRIEMRSAIKDIQRHVGITTVYVTHDQEEALAVSDRIAVMKDGIIQQVGNPVSIYSRPSNVFVATFIGHSNLFYAKIYKSSNESGLIFKNGYKLEMDNLDNIEDGDEVIAAIRPEEFSLAKITEESMKAKVITKTFLGKYINYSLQFEDKEVIPEQPSIEYSQDSASLDKIYEVNETINLKPNPKKINVFTLDMEKSLIKGVKKYE